MFRHEERDCCSHGGLRTLVALAAVFQTNESKVPEETTKRLAVSLKQDVRLHALLDLEYS